MIKVNKKNNFLYLFIVLALSIMYTPSYLNAQTADDKPKKQIKYRKARALSSKVAKLLRGKYKPNFTPHVDCGDNVIVINAEKIILSGNKWESKEYIRYTGYPGGQRSLTANELFAKDPTRLVEKSVKGMLPKNKLGANLFRNLKVYVGENHKQDGQNPVLINLKDLK